MKILSSGVKTEFHKLIHSLDIEDYHRKTAGYSSSQLKDLLDDEFIFIAKHINKTVVREATPAFDIGTYFHTGVLEPHKLKDDCIVFPGKIRRGKEWDKFKAKHAGKAIVTQTQKDTALGLIKCVKESEIAQEYLDGKPEVSLYVKIVVEDGVIYAPYFGMRLTRVGWVKDSHRPKGVEFIAKVRADMLGKDYISDLKSTTGNARSMEAMRYKISDWVYDLSASFYLDMFSLLRPNLKKFIWIFASKDLKNAKTWRATPENILIGRAKYMFAMLRLADCMTNNWEVKDTLGELPPHPKEREWLTEKDSDLL